MSSAEMTVAPCPRHVQYAGIEEVIVTNTSMDDPEALRLSCGCEVRFVFFNGEGPFEDCGHFPEDEELIKEAMYDD